MINIRFFYFCICLATLPGCALMRDLPYRDRRAAADNAFENQQYILAAARYESLRDRYPDTVRREEMLLRQGVSLYSVSSYHSARDVFIDYIKEYPRGYYLENAKDYIKKIDVLMSNATPAAAQKLAEAKAKSDLDALNKLLTEHPTDWRVYEAIGDAHWRLGNYDKAVDCYYKAHHIVSAYEERNLNNGKLILDDSGQPVPVNPYILKEMEIEKHPVRVYDLHAYTSRNQRDRVGGEIQFYNLTGSLRNQGKQLLRNVEVEVRYKDIGRNTLDVEYVKIGSLGPGEVRAFLSQADNYDNLYNIVDHEVEVHWQQ